MHNVVIYQCPVSWKIQHHTDRVIEALHDDGVAVEVVDGHYGEFDVEVDGRIVAYKFGDQLPPIQQVREAVENAIWVALPEPSGLHEAFVG